MGRGVHACWRCCGANGMTFNNTYRPELFQPTRSNLKGELHLFFGHSQIGVRPYRTYSLPLSTSWLWRRKMKLRAKFESGSSHFNFKR